RRVPERPEGYRNPSDCMEADPPWDHPADEAEAIGRGIQPDLDQRRLAASSDCAPSGRGTARTLAGGQRPLRDALRSPRHRRGARDHGGRRLQANPRRPALSAILRGDDRDGERCGVWSACEDALAAGTEDAATLL